MWDGNRTNLCSRIRAKVFHLWLFVPCLLPLIGNGNLVWRETDTVLKRKIWESWGITENVEKNWESWEKLRKLRKTEKVEKKLRKVRKNWENWGNGNLVWRETDTILKSPQKIFPLESHCPAVGLHFLPHLKAHKWWSQELFQGYLTVQCFGLKTPVSTTDLLAVPVLKCLLE